jgi:hypothetical protein
VPGTDLLRVINTRALLVLDQRRGTYYLYVADGWMQATSLEGPWIRATNPSVSLDTAKQAATASGQVDVLDDSSPEVAAALSESLAPRVDVSTTPTELLQTEGPPDLQPIDGTQLLWVKNSTSNIFLDVPSQDYYVLLSGRWFRSKSLATGPWTFVAGADLPKDFTRIRATHPAGDALPSVPGRRRSKRESPTTSPRRRRCAATPLACRSATTVRRSSSRSRARRSSTRSTRGRR